MEALQRFRVESHFYSGLLMPSWMAGETLYPLPIFQYPSEEQNEEEWRMGLRERQGLGQA